LSRSFSAQAHDARSADLLSVFAPQRKGLLTTGRGDRRPEDAAGLTRGEYEGPGEHQWDTCIVGTAILASDEVEAIESVLAEGPRDAWRLVSVRHN
jgi:hypothetical protein